MRNIDLLKNELRVWQQLNKELDRIGYEINQLRQDIKKAIKKEGRRL